MGHGRSVDDRFTVFELGEGIARGSERSRSGRALLGFRSVEGERRIGIRSTRRPGDAERHYQLYSEEFSWRRRVLVSRDQIKKEEDRCSESRLDAGRVTDGAAAPTLNSAILSNIAKRGSRCVLDPAVRKDEPKRPATCVFDGSATLKKSDRAMRGVLKPSIGAKISDRAARRILDHARRRYIAERAPTRILKPLAE